MKKTLSRKNRPYILKILLIILVMGGLFGSWSLNNNTIYATQYNWKSTQEEIKKMAQDSPISDPSKIFNILKNIVKWTYTIFFLVAIVFILIAAFNFLIAKGDPTKINNAKTQIIWAVVAIAIALISVGVAQLIKEFLEKS